MFEVLRAICQLQKMAQVIKRKLRSYRTPNKTVSYIALPRFFFPEGWVMVFLGVLKLKLKILEIKSLLYVGNIHLQHGLNMASDGLWNISSKRAIKAEHRSNHSQIPKLFKNKKKKLK